MPDRLPNRPRTSADWDARYLGDEPPPWETDRVAVQLREHLDANVLTPCRVLEIGCGTGTDSVELARRGFEVSARDWSPTAIERARERAQPAGVTVDFEVGSFPEGAGEFELVYDCGCFHTNATAEERSAFADEVARCLRPGGRWFSLAGSTEGPPRDHGPPRLSALDVVTALEPSFEILALTDSVFDANIPTPARAWVILARKRQ